MGGETNSKIGVNTRTNTKKTADTYYVLLMEWRSYLSNECAVDLFDSYELQLATWRRVKTTQEHRAERDITAVSNSTGHLEVRLVNCMFQLLLENSMSLMCQQCNALQHRSSRLSLCPQLWQSVDWRWNKHQRKCTAIFGEPCMNFGTLWLWVHTHFHRF